MENQSRVQRAAELLDRQLGSCDAALTVCLEGRDPQAVLDAWPLKRMLGLMKVSTQLANAIARLEAQAAPANREK